MAHIFKTCLSDYSVVIMNVFKAGLAQLVERLLAKQKVASSNLVSRSKKDSQQSLQGVNTALNISEDCHIFHNDKKDS